MNLKKINIEVTIEGDREDLIHKIQDIAIQLQEGYTSGEGWNTEVLDDEKRSKG
jgi:hypothetical protein